MCPALKLHFYAQISPEGHETTVVTLATVVTVEDQEAGVWGGGHVYHLSALS
jgi:hypothetical protein